MKLNLKDPTAIMIAALSDEDAGRIIKAAIRRTYGEEQDVELTGVARMAWETVEHEMHIASVRAQAGRKGAEKSNADKPAAAVTVEVTDAVPAVEPEIKPVRYVPDHEKLAEQRAERKAMMERFDRFWAAYPRRTAKQNALKSFEKLNPDDSLLNEMLNAIDRQKQSRQWNENGGLYIPHPATWLNQHRWEDEMQAQQTPSTGNRYNNPFAELAAAGL